MSKFNWQIPNTLPYLGLVRQIKKTCSTDLLLKELLNGL